MTDRLLISLGLALAGALLADACPAQTTAPDRWLYNGSVTLPTTGAWNAVQGKDPVPNAVGAHAGFFGRPGNCANDRGSPHPVAHRVEPQAMRHTGLAQGQEGDFWTPAPQAGCPPFASASHVHVLNGANTDGGPVNGGIGLYDSSGMGGANAFSGYDAAGNDGRGRAKYIEAVNFNFHVNPNLPNATRPFLPTGTLVFRSRQHVSRDAVVMQDDGRQQLRQVARVALENTACRKQFRTFAEAPCQIQVVAIAYIAGLNAWPAQSLVWLDPSEGAEPVASLYLGARGEPVIAQTRAGARDGLRVGVSVGDATQSAPWGGEREFALRMSFDEFQNMLRMSTSTRCCGGDVGRVRPSDIAAVFGDRFGSPADWAVLDVEFRDEIANRTEPPLPAAVGGHVSLIEIAAQR